MTDFGAQCLEYNNQFLFVGTDIGLQILDYKTVSLFSDFGYLGVFVVKGKKIEKKWKLKTPE